MEIVLRAPLYKYMVTQMFVDHFVVGGPAGIWSVLRGRLSLVAPGPRAR